MTSTQQPQLAPGTSRNRELRSTVDVQDEELDFAELERLFRRFWWLWQRPEQSDIRR